MAPTKFFLLSALSLSALALPAALRRDAAYAGYNNMASVPVGTGRSSLQGDLNLGVSTPSAEVYKCYQGDPSKYPQVSDWLSFDALYLINQPQILTANGGNTYIEHYIHDAIVQVSAESNVNARLILALIMQESAGDAAISCTGSTQYPNCGIMQASYNSVSFDANNVQSSILQMVREGISGTTSGGPNGQGGPGYAQYLADGLTWVSNPYPGNPYAAARGYNSGSIDSNLDSAGTGVAKYANDVANRLIGWDGFSGAGFASC